MYISGTCFFKANYNIYIYIYELGVYICNPIYTDILLCLHGNYNILVDQEMGIIMANVIWLYNDCNSL